MKSIAFLWRVIRVYKFTALALFCIILLSAMTEALGLGLVLPLLRVITDEAGSQSGLLESTVSSLTAPFPREWDLAVLSGLLVAVIGCKGILTVIHAGLTPHFVYKFRSLWQTTIMERYLCAQYSAITGQKQGVLLNNLLVEPGRAAKSLQQMIDFLSKAILALALYVLLLFVSLKITVIVTMVICLILIVARAASRSYSLGVGRQKIELSQQLTAVGAEKLSALRQIKSLGLESRSAGQFASLLKRFVRVMVRFGVVRRLPRPVGEMIAVSGIVTVLLYLRYAAQVPLDGLVPALGLYVLVAVRLSPLASDLFSQRMQILTFVPSLRLVQELLAEGIPGEDLDGGQDVEGLTDAIRFEVVSFGYVETAPVIKDLSLSFEKGQMTALVGPSGCGKSTVVDLLFGLLAPKSGRICINGISLEDLNLRSWRSLVGYVSQEAFLFNATIGENIRLGKLDASPDEVRRAAEMANAHQFVESLPQGYDTVVGDRGLNISGGQRQRIAIARVLIRDPEVLVFDEATSSLDSESERLVQGAIDALAGQKTIILISHRFSTVRNADRVHVLEAGTLADSGTFEELTRRNSGFLAMGEHSGQ